MKATVIIASSVVVSLFMNSNASAGPNVDGRLILHANESLVYSAGADYCGQSDLTACSTAVVTLAATGSTQVLHALAAFTDSLDDRLAGLTFGIQYDDLELSVDAFASCGSFELPNDDWPNAGSGTAITWSTPRSGRLIECYWFAVYSTTDASSAFALTPHPAQGGFFADPSTPAVVDSIASFGSIGFGIPGTDPCPPPESIGGGSWGGIGGE